MPGNTGFRRHFHTLCRCFFPYVFPLQIENVFDEALHAIRAILFHVLGKMPVSIQRKGCRGMAEIALNRFNIVTGADRVHRISMPKIVETKAGNARGI